MGLLDKLKKKKGEEASKEEAQVKVEAPAKKKEVKKVSESKKVEKKQAPASEKTQKKVKKGSSLGNAYKVLIRPHISEKATGNESNGVYTFVVERNATKVEIKKAIQQVYGVLPKTVRVIHMDGKKVRFGRSQGRRKDWKKAMVTLPKGTQIDVHAGV